MKACVRRCPTELFTIERTSEAVYRKHTKKKKKQEKKKKEKRRRKKKPEEVGRFSQSVFVCS